MRRIDTAGVAALHLPYVATMLTSRPGTTMTLRTSLPAVAAATFVVDRDHEQYTGRLSVEETADMILQGAGQRGPCLDYLENTWCPQRPPTRSPARTGPH